MLFWNCNDVYRPIVDFVSNEESIVLAGAFDEYCKSLEEKLSDRRKFKFWRIS